MDDAIQHHDRDYRTCTEIYTTTYSEKSMMTYNNPCTE